MSKMVDKRFKAHPDCYESRFVRHSDSIYYIVIHNTGNKGDTAENNARYFTHKPKRQAGAHYFIDNGKDTKIFKSIDRNRTAWSVGGLFKMGAPYYRKCTNYNSISIELCDIVDKPIGKYQKEKLIYLLKQIHKHHKNAQTIIRHYDVNGKNCPCYYVEHPDKWEKLKKEVEKYVKGDN